jgi:hypothetical protein
MSIEVFNDVSIALKSFWEAFFLDENNQPLVWTKPLIKSINTPRLKLIVTPTEGGITKAYTGFELPENISISIYETPNRNVEKYLDGWMFGPNGVFDKGRGVFRKRDKSNLTNIYRCVRFITLKWENDTEGSDGGVKRRQEKIDELSGNVKFIEPGIIEKNLDVKAQDNIKELERIIVKYIENRTGKYLALTLKENVRASISFAARPYAKTIIGVQQIASQLTAIAAGAANQMLGHIPAMAVGRVVIPPPLIKKPVAFETAVPIESSYRNTVNINASERQLEQELIAAISKQNDTVDIESIKLFSHDKDNLTLQDIESLKLYSSAESTEDESVEIKRYEHRERKISTTDYTCAIEGYEVAEYDYETGGPISYTVNLSVLNYKPEYS